MVDLAPTLFLPHMLADVTNLFAIVIANLD